MNTPLFNKKSITTAWYFCTIISINSCLFASITIQPTTPLQAEQSTNESATEILSDTRSINTTAAGQEKSKAVFVSHNNFYSGAGVGDETHSLDRASLSRKNGAWEGAYNELALAANTIVNDPGNKAANSPLKNEVITLLAPAAGSVVASIDVEHIYTLDTATNNGTKLLVNKSDDLATDNKKLQTAEPGVAVGLFAVAATGSEIEFNNAHEKAQFIFAATGDDAAFKDSNNAKRGIAVTKIAANNLTRCKFDDFGDDAGKAAKIDAADNAIIAVGADAFKVGKNINMVWDDHLKILYAGLDGAISDKAQNKCISGLFMGQINATGNGTLELKPIVELNANKFLNTNNGIFDGKSSAGGKDADSKLVRMLTPRVMHTSTGKDYLIVTGGVCAGDKTDANDEFNELNTWVNALPIVPADGTLAKITDVGITDFTAAIDLAVNAPQVDRTHNLANFDAREKTIVVGGDPRYISANTQLAIQDISIVGDTVYASFAEDSIDNHKTDTGIFASTALFKSDGQIRAWTPWQRVMGSVEKVAQFGVDPKTNNTWFVEGTDKKSTKITTWSTGDATLHTDKDKTLNAALKPLASAGGVYSLTYFDGETPGFKAVSATKHDAFNMAVATGQGAVAMIQAGVIDADIFKPTTEYKSSYPAAPIVDDTVFVFPNDNLKTTGKDDSDLAALGAITCAEVARIPVPKPHVGLNKKGWLFVGGENGLAVLRDSTGLGWEIDGAAAVSGLEKLADGTGNAKTDFPVGTDYTFKQIKDPTGASIKNIRKLVSDTASGKMYVLTRDALYRITMDAADFADASLKVADANFLTIFDLQSGKVGTTANAVQNGLPIDNHDKAAASTVTLQKDADQLFDMVLVQSDRTGGTENTTIALATSQGVIISSPFKDAVTDLSGDHGVDTNLAFRFPTNAAAAANLELGPTFKFDSVYQRRGNAPIVAGNKKNAQANVYATAVDKGLGNVAVYRFDVSGGDMTVFKEQFQDNAGNATDYFYKIGDIKDKTILDGITPLDLFPRAADIGLTDTNVLAVVPMNPDPTKYTLAEENDSAKELELKRTFNDRIVLPLTPIRDVATGALYIPYDGGVLVNE